MNKYIEEVEWYDICEVLPGFDDRWEKVVYMCLCLVVSRNDDGTIDKNDDPEIAQLMYFKDESEWHWPFAGLYPCYENIVAWAKVPKGPFHRYFNGNTTKEKFYKIHNSNNVKAICKSENLNKAYRNYPNCKFTEINYEEFNKYLQLIKEDQNCSIKLF